MEYIELKCYDCGKHLGWMVDVNAPHGMVFCDEHSDYKGMEITIQKDTNYGIDKRNGWSVAFDGHFVVELEPCFLRAAYKAWRYWLSNT